MIHDILEKQLKENLSEYYRDFLGLRNWESLIQKRLSLEFEKEYSERFETIRSNDATGLLLDVGTGWGGFPYLRHRERFYGIEPDPQLCKLATLRLQALGINSRILMAVGEALPFKDNIFSYVTCYTVLEHCRDPFLVLKEIIRVLNPGGVLHLIVPNYLSWYEGHYKIFYPPMVPKPLAKAYLFLRNRPTKFIEHINYINNFAVRKYLNRLPVSFSHSQEIYYKARFNNVSKLKGRTKRFILSIVKNIGIMPLVTTAVLWIFPNFVCHSAEFVIRKEEDKSKC